MAGQTADSKVMKMVDRLVDLMEILLAAMRAAEKADLMVERKVDLWAGQMEQR